MNYISLENISFLVADKNKQIRQLVTQFLNIFGAKKITVVGSGQEVLEEFAFWIPDILIAGWEMYPVDGLELTRTIRRMEGNRVQFTPILMISERTEIENIVAARDSGINEFLAKPFSAKGLYSRVHNIIEHPRIFVKTATFIGPCRRRKTSENYAGPERRGNRNNNLTETQVNALLGKTNIFEE